MESPTAFSPALELLQPRVHERIVLAPASRHGRFDQFVDFWRLSFESVLGQIFVENFSVFGLNEVNQTVWSGLDGDKFVPGFQAHDGNQIRGFNRRFCRRLFLLRNGNRGPGGGVRLRSRSDGCQDRDAGQYDGASDDDQFGFHRFVSKPLKPIARIDGGQQSFNAHRDREMALGNDKAFSAQLKEQNVKEQKFEASRGARVGILNKNK
jgi:hypothetical protein